MCVVAIAGLMVVIRAASGGVDGGDGARDVDVGDVVGEAAQAPKVPPVLSRGLSRRVEPAAVVEMWSEWDYIKSSVLAEVVCVEG